jgi:hypothetical protein
MKRDLYIRNRDRMISLGLNFEIEVLDAYFNIVLLYSLEGQLLRVI